MPDSGIDISPAKRPGSSRVKNVADDTPKSIKEVNGFEIVEKVGQGGMGAVYKARQKSLDRVVALKVLPPRIAKNAKFIERFQREARASAKLCHPNLVQGIDVGQDPVSKLWYFAMEFIDGPTLKKLIKEEQRIPQRRALEIVREVARALDAIHSEGMIHRDIKPDNIILTSRGDVKVADFGLTREVEDDAEMTQSGSAVGTPHYMPPEQVRGLRDLDIRADLYALGATLFHILTGKTPFVGSSSAEVLSKHLTEPVPLAHKLCPEVTEPCSRLIVKLMEKDREDRVQTPQDLVARINALLDPNNAATGKRTTIMNAARSSGMRQAVRAGTSGQRNAVGNKTGQRAAVGTGPVVAIGGGIESTGPLQRVTTGKRAAISNATTGSASPVGADGRPDASASAARKAVQKKNPALMWAMMVLPVLGVVALFALLSGKSEKPTAQKQTEIQTPATAAIPAPAPILNSPAPAKAPGRDEKARAVLNSALEAEKARPDEFAAVLDTLNSAAQLGRDTSVAIAVEQARKDTEARWTETFSKTLKTLTAAADAACARGDFAAALGALDDKGIPENLRVLNWREQLDAGRKTIHDSAESAVKKIIDDAQALAKTGDEAGINGALEKLKAGDAIPAALAPSTAKLAEERARFTTELAALREKADATKKERLEKAQAAAAAVRKELAPVLAQSHFTAALEQLEKKMQDPALSGAKEALAADKADLEAILALRQNAIAAIRASGGKTITLNRGKTSLSGKVVDDPNGKSITLKLPDGPEMSIGIDQLEARDINAFAPTSTADGAGKAEDARRRGLLFLAADDVNKAKAFFKTAQENGLGDAVKPYLDRIEIMELGETEVHARKDWADAEALFNAKQWKEAQLAFAAFQAQYGKTRIFAESSALFQAQVRTVNEALMPTIPGLKLWLKLDDTDGSKAVNSAENGAPADVIGCKWTSESKIGSGAIQLNGQSDYIMSPNLGAAFADGSVTITVWVKPAAGGVIVDELGQAQLDTGWHDSQIELMNDGELKLRVWNMPGMSAGKISMNQWHHVVLRYSKKDKTLDGFVDGVKGEGKVNGDKAWNGSMFYAFGARDGQQLGHGGFFKGALDDIRIYNRALSDDEVKRISGEK